MRKRLISIILALLMIFSMTACTGYKREATSKGNIVSPDPNEGNAELTILINAIEYETMKTDFFSNYIDKFEKDFGVKINFERITTGVNGQITQEGQDAYIKKIVPKLSVKDGPELIFVEYMSMGALIKQQAFVDLQGKFTNLNKLYNKFLEEKVYYAPVGMRYYSRSLKQDALESLGIKAPNLDWSSKEYYDIREKWISHNEVYFNSYEYYKVFDSFINLKSLYNEESKHVIINTPEVKQKLRNIRDYIFDGKYIINSSYKYENYYNMIFEDTSKESEESQQLYNRNNDSGHIDGGNIVNLFSAKELHYKSKNFGTIMYPEFADREVFINSCGFAVNKNGKNLELAYEFINGLLSNDIQMSMYNEGGYYYPTNQEIEADILKDESKKSLDQKAIELKAYALQELKEGKCKLWNTLDQPFNRLNFMMHKDFSKLILADNPYSDVELSAELQKLENEYNIWLSE